ncbi:MAG: hypothetical protein ABIE07_02030 [Candidatus Zixiibacteriota bacterium]
MKFRELFEKYILSFFRPMNVNEEIAGLNPEINISQLPGPFSYSVALGRYTVEKFHEKTDMGLLIHMMKYRQNTEAARKLTKILIDFIREYPFPQNPNLVITIPDTMTNRQNSPVKYLAEAIGKEFNWLVRHDIFSNIKVGLPQKTRTFDERIEDIHKRYRLNCPQLVQGKHILLFDDIFATGQSMIEAAQHIWDHHPHTVMAMTLVKLGSKFKIYGDESEHN